MNGENFYTFLRLILPLDKVVLFLQVCRTLVVKGIILQLVLILLYLYALLAFVEEEKNIYLVQFIVSVQLKDPKT